MYEKRLLSIKCGEGQGRDVLHKHLVIMRRARHSSMRMQAFQKPAEYSQINKLGEQQTKQHRVGIQQIGYQRETRRLPERMHEPKLDQSKLLLFRTQAEAAWLSLGAHPCLYYGFQVLGQLPSANQLALRMMQIVTSLGWTTL